MIYDVAKPVIADLMFRFRQAHMADPTSERTTLINGALLAIEREWPQEWARYQAEYGPRSTDMAS